MKKIKKMLEGVPKKYLIIIIILSIFLSIFSYLINSYIFNKEEKINEVKTVISYSNKYINSKYKTRKVVNNYYYSFFDDNNYNVKISDEIAKDLTNDIYSYLQIGAINEAIKISKDMQDVFSLTIDVDKNLLTLIESLDEYEDCLSNFYRYEEITNPIVFSIFFMSLSNDDQEKLIKTDKDELNKPSTTSFKLYNLDKIETKTSGKMIIYKIFAVVNGVKGKEDFEIFVAKDKFSKQFFIYDIKNKTFPYSDYYILNK